MRANRLETDVQGSLLVSPHQTLFSACNEQALSMLHVMCRYMYVCLSTLTASMLRRGMSEDSNLVEELEGDKWV